MLIVDRIEGNRAVCFHYDENENKGSMELYLPLSVFEGSVKEGDIAFEKDERYYIDASETKKRRYAARERFDRLRLRHKEDQ